MFPNGWEHYLAVVVLMATAIATAHAVPAFARKSSTPSARTLGGAALFGVGWGLSGVCPGPAMAGLGAGNWPLVLALAAMLAGAYVQGRFFGEVK